MLKLLLAAVVVAGVVIGAAQVMHKNHTNAPIPGPVVVKESVPNPFGGDSGSQSGGSGGQVVIP